MKKTDTLFYELNEQQIAATKHLEGPALVVAGPGSGKTRVLTHRIVHLISEHNIPELNILCVTFTNKAANEIKKRVKNILRELNSPYKTISWGGTFHSICARILRKDGYLIGTPPSFVIYDTDDQVALIKNVSKAFGIDTKRVNPKAIANSISGAKSELVNPTEYEQYAKGYFQKSVANIYYEYQKRLRQNDALDFDDLLFETVNLFRRNENALYKYQNLFRYILIDEYQDTNKAQYTIAKLLAQRHKNIFVVGDMSQAIYSFRGADYRNILNFQTDYPGASIYNLERNYRSTQTILDAAKSVIKNNSTHIPLDLWTEKKANEKITVYTGYDQDEEAEFITEQILDHLATGLNYKDIAILYRTNAQSRNIEETLIKNNIPYKIVGGFRFYSRKEIKDVVSFLRVIHNPKDEVSWERIINVPPKGIGAKTVQKIRAGGWDLDEIQSKTKLPFKHWVLQKDTLSTLELMELILEQTGYVRWLNDGTEENRARIENIEELKSVAATFVDLEEFLENVALIESSNKPNQQDYNGVTLMTIHASKGLEFPLVILVGMEEGLFPHSRSLMELHELEEERRLCYVAITRAMKKLIMTNTNSRLYFGRIENNLPSRFIEEIPSELVETKGQPTAKRSNRGVNFDIDEFMDSVEMERSNFSWE